MFLVLMKVKVINKFHYTLGATQMTSVSEKPIKSIGSVFNSSMEDTPAICAPNLELAWLSMVDKTGLLGKFQLGLTSMASFRFSCPS